MTFFGGDKIEGKSNWSRARSNTVLGLIIFAIVMAIVDESSRGYALMILGLILTVMLHEAGHFVAAKWAKMKATEFFVGFGPRIWSFKRGETEYGIKAIPLGGYVKIIGMTNLDEVDPEDEARTYRKSKTGKKLVVILAGVTVNVVLAYILIFASFVGQGVPTDVGTKRAEIAKVTPNSPSRTAGLKKGDLVTKINNDKISNFDELVLNIRDHKVGEKVKITYVRDGETRVATAKLTAATDEKGVPTKFAFLGVQRVVRYERVAPAAAISKSGQGVYRVLDLTVGGVTRLFSASGLSKYSKTVVDGDYKRQDRPSSLAGIVDTGGQLVNQDFWDLINIMAVINIALAFFNVLPLLPLDGGHAAVAIFERIISRIKKREVYADYKKLLPIATIVIAFFAVFMLSTLWLDILQITS